MEKGLNGPLRTKPRTLADGADGTFAPGYDCADWERCRREQIVWPFRPV